MKIWVVSVELLWTTNGRKTCSWDCFHLPHVATCFAGGSDFHTSEVPSREMIHGTRQTPPPPQRYGGIPLEFPKAFEEYRI
jgi:hypothetical protein